MPVKKNTFPPIDAIILAAGKGSRMKSSRLKVIHEVAGKPIINYVLDAVSSIGVHDIYMVVGHQSESVKALSQAPNITHVLQAEQLGTGHAVMQTIPYLKEEERLTLILAGDCPLIEPETLTQLITTHIESNAAGTILTSILETPSHYGRILRGKTGVPLGIREAKDCSPEEYAIKEINTGIYCFNQNILSKTLSKLSTNNAQSEYYLTDLIHILREGGKPIEAYCTPQAYQAIGVNTRQDLAEINRLLYQKNNTYHMTHGVTIIDPKSTFIDSDVTIENDTIIHPFTVIKGRSRIASNCCLGPHVSMIDSTLKEGEVVPPFSAITAKR